MKGKGKYTCPVSSRGLYSASIVSAECIRRVIVVVGNVLSKTLKASKLCTIYFGNRLEKIWKSLATQLCV